MQHHCCTKQKYLVDDWEQTPGEYANATDLFEILQKYIFQVESPTQNMSLCGNRS